MGSLRICDVLEIDIGITPAVLALLSVFEAGRVSQSNPELTVNDWPACSGELHLCTFLGWQELQVDCCAYLTFSGHLISRPRGYTADL